MSFEIDYRLYRGRTKLKLLLSLWLRHRKQNRAKRSYWVHPICRHCRMFGEYHHLTPQILEDIDKCLLYMKKVEES